jgi:D-alanine-D-alanine ligase-like ATP-grasp enzyme
MNIGVLRGGKIREHDSHLSAAEILADLRLGEYKIIDITIDQNGDWYERGIKTTPHQILPYVDVVVNTTKETSHVSLIRDFKIPKLFEVEPKIDNVRRLLFQLGIKYPNYTIISKKQIDESDMHNLWRTLHLPLVIKSQTRLLPSLLTYDPKESLEYIKEIQKRGDTPVVDSHVKGRLYHVAAVSNLRGERVYIPTILESFKKGGKNNYVRAQSLNENEKMELRDMICKTHVNLDLPLAVYDFVKNKNGFTLVHVSTKPRYTEGSLLHEAFMSSGVTFREIVAAMRQK